MNLEEYYDLTLEMSVEHLNRCENLYCNKKAESELHKRDLNEIIELVRKDVTDTQLYKFLETFTLWTNTKKS